VTALPREARFDFRGGVNKTFNLDTLDLIRSYRDGLSKIVQSIDPLRLYNDPKSLDLDLRVQWDSLAAPIQEGLALAEMRRKKKGLLTKVKKTGTPQEIAALTSEINGLTTEIDIALGKNRSWPELAGLYEKFAEIQARDKAMKQIVGETKKVRREEQYEASVEEIQANRDPLPGAEFEDPARASYLESVTVKLNGRMDVLADALDTTNLVWIGVSRGIVPLELR